MNLKIFLPTEIFMEQKVLKIKAEAINGSFCLLPRHIDFSAVLVPGIFIFEPQLGEENFLAMDEGFLVKCGHDVLISTRNVVGGKKLGELEHHVEEEFEKLNEQEKKFRSVLSKLEADFVRRFLSWSSTG